MYFPPIKQFISNWRSKDVCLTAPVEAHLNRFAFLEVLVYDCTLQP